MSDLMQIRRSITVALIAGVAFGAWDIYLFFTRTATMAPVSFSRLALSLLCQSLAVLGISSLSLPPTARIRKLQSAWFTGGPFFLVAFGVILGVGLAAGAIHYSNCLRWGLSSGSFCTPYP